MTDQEKRDDDILQLLLLPVVFNCHQCSRPLFRTSVRRSGVGNRLSGIYECPDCKRTHSVDPPEID